MNGPWSDSLTNCLYPENVGSDTRLIDRVIPAVTRHAVGKVSICARGADMLAGGGGSAKEGPCIVVSRAYN